MKTRYVWLFALIGTLAAGSAAAQDFGVGLKAGTLGLGLEGTLGFSRFFNARLGLNRYNYEYDEKADDIKYDAELDLNTTALILDWHPFGGTFRLSAGLVNNQNAVSLKATPTSNQEIGNTTYTPAQIGTLSGEVKFKENVPYLGLGWGNAVGKGAPFGFNFEIGVIKQGKADVSLKGKNGTLSGDPAFQDDLDREEKEAESDLSEFDTYPVVSLGFSYRF